MKGRNPSNRHIQDPAIDLFTLQENSTDSLHPRHNTRLELITICLALKMSMYITSTTTLQEPNRP